LRETVSIDDVIALLNEAAAADPQAMIALIGNRVLCNEKLAAHPAVQVGRYASETSAEMSGPNVGSVTRVGVLGLLNGVFGINEQGYGPIVADIDNHANTIRFMRTSESGYDQAVKEVLANP
jgi:hypothetical protein